LLGSYPRSIRGRLVALTVALFVLFIWTLVYVSVTVVQDDFDDLLLDQQFAAVEQVAADLENKLDERLTLLSQAAGILPSDLRPEALDGFLVERFGLHFLFPAGIAVIGLDGVAIADYPVTPGRRGTFFGDRDYFRRVVETGKPHIDKPVLGRALQRPVLTIGMPVFDSAGKLRAVLTGITDLGARNFLGNLTDPARFRAGLGEFFVVSRHDRIIVAASDRSRVLTKAPEPGANATTDRFLAGFEGSAFGVSSRGIARLYSAKQIPTADWVVFAALSLDVARRPMALMKRYVYGAAAAITLLAVFVLWAVTRRMLAPLENASASLRRMSAGEQPLAPLPVTAEDEVGELIGNFNRLLAERQRYEAALADSEQRFRLLVESSPDAIFVQTGGCYAYVNEATVRLLGADSKAQILGTPCIDRVHPESRTEVAERIRRINATRADSPPLEEKYVRLDGSEVAVEVSAVPFSFGGEEGALVFVRNITERKRGEQALKSLNRDFVSLLENTSDFIYFKDRDSRYRFCSQPLARSCGRHDWRELIGKDEREIIAPDMARIYHEEDQQVFREGQPLIDRISPYCDENGNAGWLSTSKWPVFDDDGTSVVGVFGISRVITERVQADAKLVAINKELQAFTYAASHDIKAPLGRINAFSSLLEQKYRERLEGDGLLFLDLIQRNAKRLIALVDDLLAHAEIEQKILALQPLNLRETVECIVKEYGEEIRQGKVEVRLDLPEITVQAHPHGLAQVLRNLLENALKYSAPVAAPVIQIGAWVEEGRCHLWVRDNGIGFDMAYRERIFEVFRRLHTYEEFPGSGIGLALVRKAMERMNGRVWAEGEPGKGATFHLELHGRMSQGAEASAVEAV